MKPITLTPTHADKYRPDIDGLRAIAVLAVVFFHYGVETFSGGFIGVDVFFVISGFLITRLITESLSGDTFTFGGFYLRRARRLLPALLFTIFASFAMGALVFSPQHLERLGGSALHGLLSISNFYFWAESGYFDAASRVKPLLHLWSLSVEEQFYFVWPATLLLLNRTAAPRRATVFTLLMLGVASWGFAQWCLDLDPPAAFYMLPSRIVEFCMGAVTVQLVRLRTPMWVREGALVAGLVLIGYATVVFTEATPFPGSTALIPCLGTSLAIFGGSSRFTGALLRSRPMVFTGLISYSLYLCHWPIYVFYMYVTDTEQLSYPQVFSLTALSFVVATLMYRFVERPFRFVRSGGSATPASTRFVLGCALYALILAYASATAWATGGWYWRFSNAGKLAEVFDLDQLRIESIEYHQAHVSAAAFNATGKRILVVGDSHARDVSNGLEEVLAGRGYQVRSLELDESCLAFIRLKGSRVERVADREGRFVMMEDGPRDCAAQIDTYLKSSKTQMADIIVFSAALTGDSIKSIGNFVRLARRRSNNDNLHLVIMDRAVSYQNMHAKAIKAYAEGVSTGDINRYAWIARRGPFFDKVIRSTLAEAGLLDQVTVVSKDELQCSKPSCDFFTEEGELAIWDANHWTLPGAKLFMSRFVEQHPELFP